MHRSSKDSSQALLCKDSSKASSKANSKASSRKVNKVAKVVSRLCLTNKRIQAAHPRLPGDCSSRRLRVRFKT